MVIGTITLTPEDSPASHTHGKQQELHVQQLRQEQWASHVNRHQHRVLGVQGANAATTQVMRFCLDALRLYRTASAAALPAALAGRSCSPC